MPSVKGLNPEDLALRCARPCPASGSGNREVHRWIMRAASIFAMHRVPIEQAHEVIANAITRPEKPKGEIAEALFKAYGTKTDAEAKPKVEIPPYSLDTLIRYAERCPIDITEDWLAEVSPECVLDVSPSDYLNAIYFPGECVCVLEDLGYKKSAIWTHGDSASSLKRLETGYAGVWYVCNPVTGTEINGSWRSEPNVTSFRYCLLESDKAPTDLWLRALVQLNLPISAIYTSGKRSVHAIVRIDAKDKREWDNVVRRGEKNLMAQLVQIGADAGAMTAVRPTRLPGCVRGETGNLQKLLFLNPNPEQQPIINLC